MPTILIYVDRSIYQNSALTQAMQRKLEAKNKSICAIHYLEYNDTTLINILQNILDDAQECCIAASGEAYPLVCRVLATLKDDVLIATGNTLHPATALEVKQNSYLLHLNDVVCNVVLLKSEAPIPEMLLDCDEAFATWQLFGNKEHLRTLKQHARNSQYHFDSFEVVEGWYEIHTSSIYQIDKLLSHSYNSTILLFPSKNIFDTCIEVLRYKGETVTFAESCTGGLIASFFTARSGSSDILKGSLVTYANEIKQRWLKVDQAILDNPGAVSEACVVEMAQGAKRLAQSDIALATSGIAGPTGGTPLKPVGTVYIAAANSAETRTKHLLLKGDRNYIQYQAMMQTIKLMVELEKKNFEEFFRNA